MTGRPLEEITDSLKGFDSEDPVKYDFALFGLGSVLKSFDHGQFLLQI
jgi:hypothetical protein